MPTGEDRVQTTNQQWVAKAIVVRKSAGETRPGSNPGDLTKTPIGKGTYEKYKV
jgi:hypothetical protein